MPGKHGQGKGPGNNPPFDPPGPGLSDPFQSSPLGQSPVAHDDHFVMNEGALLAANLFIDNGFGADSDAQGDPLAVSEVAGDPAKVGFPILVTSVDGRHWSDQGRSQREPRLDIER